MNITHFILLKFWAGAGGTAVVVPLVDEGNLVGGLQKLDGGLE